MPANNARSVILVDPTGAGYTGARRVYTVDANGNYVAGGGSPYIYLPSGWDAGWVAAKAASGTTPAWMMALGDSITAGQATTSYLTQGYIGLLRTALIAKYGGTPYADWYACNYNDANNLVNTPPLPWTNSGGQSSGGLNGGYQFTTTGSVTFTSPQACTGLDILYQNRIAGTWTYSLDGGAAVTVTDAGASGGHKKVNLGRSLANTVHTVTVTWVSGVLNLSGISCFYGTTGLGFANMATGGAQSIGFIAGGNTNLQMNFVGQGGGMAVPFGFPFQPSLFILAMGVNDLSNANIGPGMWFHTYRKIIHGIRRSVPNLSTLIVSPSLGGGATYNDGAGSWGNSDSWGQWVAAARQLAVTENCAHVNMDAKWGSTPVAQGFLTNDVHPTIAGHQDIYNTIAGVLV